MLLPPQSLERGELPVGVCKLANDVWSVAFTAGVHLGLASGRSYWILQGAVRSADDLGKRELLPGLCLLPRLRAVNTDDNNVSNEIVLKF
jgi:hypothetical protein